MDREPLAMVENNQYIVMGEGPTLFHFGPFNGYHNEASEKAKLFNAAASEWLDRELKKALQENIDAGRFANAPCYICGYNGPGYFQPDTHECAGHLAAIRSAPGKEKGG